MLCDMRRVLKNSAGRIGELRRTNVRWFLLTVVCLTATLLAWACGDAGITPEERAQEWAEQLQAWEECMSKEIEITHERVKEVIAKHRALLRRQPNQYGFGGGESMLNEHTGETLERAGIVVYVTDKVDQSTLPEEDRIQDCLDGVPMWIIEAPNTLDLGGGVS